MVETTEGIVLKTSDYKENSKILQVFTKEHGLIGIYLKGANNYKNRNYHIAQPISHASFRINYHEGLSSCYQGEMITSYNKLKIDYNKSLYVFHLFELILKTIEQHKQLPMLFDMLLTVLDRINQTSDLLKVECFSIILEIKLLYFIGVNPVLDYCVECGQNNHIVNFDIQKGGFVCRNCQDIRSRNFSLDSLKYIHHFFYENIDSIFIDKISQSTIKELRLLLLDYYNYHLGVKSNSSKYFP